MGCKLLKGGEKNWALPLNLKKTVIALAWAPHCILAPFCTSYCFFAIDVILIFMFVIAILVRFLIVFLVALVVAFLFLCLLFFIITLVVFPSSCLFFFLITLVANPPFHVC